MSSVKLSKLEELSERQADHSRSLVELQRMELQILNQHHRDLMSINKEYQNGVVGKEVVQPQLLAHRRAFVSQLSEKLEQLKQRQKQQEEQLKTKLREHRKHASQTIAIGAMVEREQQDEQVAFARLEQRHQEDSLHALQQTNQSNEDEEHG